MKNEVFGNIIYKGKMINLDKEDIIELERISDNLENKIESLNSKMITVFNR